MSPRDVCRCGLSRALHVARAPETRDHAFALVIEVSFPDRGAREIGRVIGRELPVRLGDA